VDKSRAFGVDEPFPKWSKAGATIGNRKLLYCGW